MAESSSSKENKKEKWTDLQVFIHKHRVEKGCEYTHTYLGNIPYSFYVPADEVKKFMKLYEDAFVKQSENLYITEKNRHIGPIVADLDFRFVTNDPNVRVYDSDFIQTIVDVYASAIKKFFTCNENDYIFIQQKESPVANLKGKGNQKDGIHIIIPSIVTKASVKYMIRNEVIKKFEELQLFKDCVNSVSDIVDESVIERNSWYMYGSKKKSSTPYVVTGIYNMDCEELDVDIEEKEYIHIFSIRNKNKEREVKPSIIEEINAYEKACEEEKIKIKMKKKIITSSSNNNLAIYENIESIENLVNMLNPERAERYEDWIRLGWCLRNIDSRLDTVWESFSAQSSKYKTGECLKIWNKMKQGGLNVGTLRMWAKSDNPDKYNEFIKNDLSDLIYASKSKTHHDIAKVVHHMFQHSFVCSSAKGKYWYEFKNHRWIPIDQGISLRMKLSDHVWKEYKKEIDKYNRLSMAANNQADQDNYHETCKIYHDICTKLRTTTFKENVMKECAELFFVDRFEERLDSDPNLICFENGVYDLEEHKFRDGRPEDYLSFTTGVNYKTYDPNDESTIAINEYLEQVLVKKPVREYVMKLFSTFISGNVKEQKFYIWTGSGSNSKSKLVELFEKSFGDYCCKFPITLLTQKRVASNAANTELARSKGKRFACLQEPSDDEKINIGLMKELSGGDKIMARALYKEPIEFSPQFKMLLLCNQLPYVPSDDGGTWRRIRVVEFTSKFVEEPIEPNEFPIDYNLSDKMEHWGEGFMSMLIHYYKLYEKEGISEPYDVLKCTHEYKMSNDHLSAFISNKVEKKEGAFLTMDEIHLELKNWIKDDNIPIKLPSKPEFEKYVHRNLGKITTVDKFKGVKGFRIKSWESNEEAVEPS